MLRVQNHFKFPPFQVIFRTDPLARTPAAFCHRFSGAPAQVEQLYREEALNRKKIFNAMEDLKVRRLGS